MMNCSLSYPSPRPLPSTSQSRHHHSISITSKHTQQQQHHHHHHQQPKFQPSLVLEKTSKNWPLKPATLAIHVGALLAAVEQPALAVTGVNNEEDFTWVLIQLGIMAFVYLFVVPPFLLNWLRLRWYKRKLLEMYVQFMCVFMFFPGLLLWAPFVNFRRLPRDPTMKYPWSTPQDPSLTDTQYRP